MSKKGGPRMERRAFFRACLAACAAPFTIPLAAAAPARHRTLVIQESPIAGFQYHHGEAVWSMLRVGQPLTLVREPTNPYDSRAVRVEWNDHKLGYVPRQENTAVAQMLDRGERLEAMIARLEQSPNPWARVRLAVYLAEDV